MNEPVIPLHIAEIIISDRPSIISTVLGSCISVCLYAPLKKIGGMIHYALPSPDYESLGILSESSSDKQLRYGNYAIPLLIEKMVEKTNLTAEHFIAKIVGGAQIESQLKTLRQIGDINIATAEKILKRYHIPIEGRDVGGKVGKRLFFYTETGRVRVAPLEGLPSLKVENVERPPKKESIKKKKKVLIVDDSPTIQKLLTKILSESDQLEVVGVASDPLMAQKMIEELRPDVMTLDIYMPHMDGVTFLEQLLPQKAIPTIMISSISMEESNQVLKALELGAVDYIQKPSLGDLAVLGPLICEKVIMASNLKVKIFKFNSSNESRHVSPNLSNTNAIVAIGASTGGTEALKAVLRRLPAGIPPIVIVQHIPPLFSTAFSHHLNELCQFEVKEAVTGDILMKNRVLIAPGGKQMAIEPFSKGFRVIISDDPPVNRHKPSVDYLFHSVSKHVGKKAIGIILTGMGSDGAKGLFEMKKQGARTMAQDEATSVVYGMPKAAKELNAVDEVIPLDKVAETLLKWLS